MCHGASSLLTAAVVMADAGHLLLEFQHAMPDDA